MKANGQSYVDSMSNKHQRRQEREKDIKEEQQVWTQNLCSKTIYDHLISDIFLQGPSIFQWTF